MGQWVFPVWPKANNLLAVAVEEDVADKPLDGVRDLRKDMAGQGVKAFVLPCDAVISKAGGVACKTELMEVNKRMKMDISGWIMLLLVCALGVSAYMKNPALVPEGLKAGGKLFWEILPTMILAFIAAGIVSVILPRELMTRWLGEDSGLRGLIIATLAGSLTPGGPFVQFPIVAALFKAGAGVAPLMAYITAWSVLGMNRFLVYEVPLLGWKLSMARMAASLVFPIIIGLLTRLLWTRL